MGTPVEKSKQVEEKNWIPQPFQKAAEFLAKDAVSKFLKHGHVVGLGSGPMTAAIVREMKNVAGKDTLSFIPSSFQIKLEAERSGLMIVDADMMPKIDVVFDGADEVDSEYHMIKGGGGALFREKIIHSAAKKIVIAAESKKFVQSFTWPVPIEVHPFAAHIVKKRLEADYYGVPTIRMLNERYPYVTENGNFVFDTSFDFKKQSDIEMLEKDLKNIAGVIQVGLFSHIADVYYKAKEDGTFELIQTR